MGTHAGECYVVSLLLCRHESHAWNHRCRRRLLCSLLTDVALNFRHEKSAPRYAAFCRNFFDP